MGWGTGPAAGKGGGGVGVVRALKFSEFSFPCCRLPSLAPQECSVEPDKGKVRDLVCVGCSVVTERPLACDLPWEEQQTS